MKSRPASKQTRRPRQHAIDEQVLCNGFKRACASQTLEETDGLTEDAATWCSEQYQVLRTSCIGIINLRDTLYLVQLETQAGNLGYRHYHDFGEIIQKPTVAIGANAAPSLASPNGSHRTLRLGFRGEEDWGAPGS